MKTMFGLLIAVSMSVGALSVRALSTDEIQARIDAAASGDTVYIPAGTYTGTVTIKDHVFLVGEEGAEKTILDGGGAPTVVTAGRHAAIAGFTIQNGNRGFYNGGRFVGVFECRVQDVRHQGLVFAKGSGVVANNLLVGYERGDTGIFVNEADPFISNNRVFDHNIGIQLYSKYVSTIIGNTFAQNTIAILAGPDTELMLDGNIFYANTHHIRGHALGVTDTIVEQLELIYAIPHAEKRIEAYKELMDVIYEKTIRRHAAVVYGLPIRGLDTGRFQVTTYHPWASFTVAASTLDTHIERNHWAYDLIGDRALHSEFKAYGKRPAVTARNPKIVERESERYMLDTWYVHPASFYRDEDGRLIFKRTTNLARIEIEVPDGYIPTAVNYPATFEWVEGRVVVKIDDIGYTTIEMSMVPAASGEDPLGVFVAEAVAVDDPALPVDEWDEDRVVGEVQDRNTGIGYTLEDVQFTPVDLGEATFTLPAAK